MQVRAGDHGHSIIVTGMDRIEVQKAKDVLQDILQTINFLIPQHVDVSSHGEKIRKFLTEQERSMALKIHFQPSKMLVEIVGIDEAVAKTKSVLEQFFESMRIKKQILTGYNPPRVWKFLEIHFQEIIKEKSKLLSHDVPIQLEKQASGDYQISMTGNEEDIVACEDILKKLIKKITQKVETIASPGLTAFLNAKNGQDELKRIESHRKVYIEPQLSSGLSLPIKSRPVSELLSNVNVTSQDATYSRSPQCQTQMDYNSHNFITKEGLQFYCKLGRIEDEKVSVSSNESRTGPSFHCPQV